MIQGIIVIDINNFKLINDTYGHLVGDKIIKEMAKRLKRVLRNQDRLSRWGGDEFAIYLSNLSDSSKLDSIIEYMHNEVKKPFHINSSLLNIEISLGYSIYPDNGISYEELYEKADIMMYSNKPINE